MRPDVPSGANCALTSPDPRQRRLVVERKAKGSNSRREDPGEFTVMLARQGFVAGETIDVFIEGSDETLSALARNEGLVKLKRVSRSAILLELCYISHAIYLWYN